MERESIQELIKKLFNLAASPNEHEASLAMAKAQELLLKHNISMSEIKTNDNKEEAAILNEVVEFEDGRAESWERILLHKLCGLNFCQSINDQSKGHVVIVGRAYNVIAVEAMYNWIEPQIVRFAGLSGFHGQDKVAYILGMISRLHERLALDKMQYQNKATPDTRAVIVGCQAEVDAAFKQLYPRVSNSSSRCSGSEYARNAGRNDAGQVAIYGSSRQVNSGTLALNKG